MMLTIDDQWLTETVALFEKYIQALAAKELAIAAEGQAVTMLKGQFVRLLANASSQSSAPPVPQATALPTISGTAQVGQTLTLATGAIWTGLGANPVYEHQWQEAAAPFTTWTNISGATATSYVSQAGDADKVIRCGERVSGDYGFSNWSYSAPSGIVVASAPPVSAPTINTPASFTASAPVYVGATVQINAPSVTGATAWWVRVVRDGVEVINGLPVATDVDTFPVSYTVIDEDIGTTFELITYASNAAGVVSSAHTSNIGPIGLAPTGAITDLGSFAATKAFIVQQGGLDNLWTASGTPTDYLTVTSAQQLSDLWTQQVKPAAFTKRWQITLDWDGLSALTAGQTTLLTLKTNGGATAWSDNGGWVRLINATGKKPAISNQVHGYGLRGIEFDGVRLAGQTAPGSTINQQKAAASLKLWINASFPAEPVVNVFNGCLGRNAVAAETNLSTYGYGIQVSGGIAEQIYVDTVKVSGIYSAFLAPCRRARLNNIDVSRLIEDNIKWFGHTKSNYYAYGWVSNYTVRDCVLDWAYRAGHKDFAQTGVNYSTFDYHLGYRMIYENVVSNNEHKFSGGGSQGLYNDDYGNADNLFAVDKCIFLQTSPAGIMPFSPQARYKSHIERTTLGRAGTCPSGFSPDTGTPQDFKSGIGLSASAQGISPPYNGGSWLTDVVGVKFRFKDCLVGYLPTQGSVETPGTIYVDYTVARTSPTPEAVFNGTNFERGGPSTNGIANKFGFTIDQATSQANFIAAMIANFTPQGAYAAKGCPAPNPADFTAPLN